LALVAGYYRIQADAGQLRHELALGDRTTEPSDVLRAARLLGLKAKVVTRNGPEGLRSLPTPAMLRFNGNNWVVLLRRSNTEKWIVLQIGPHGVISHEFSEIALGAMWTGEAVLLARKLGGPGIEPAVFNFSWFAPTLWRYRKALGGVLLATFFLQLFALVTPLFFQLVVDKVLLHKSISTLTMVATGLIALGLFDCTLQYLRTYLLSHTTCRIDAELGARLFEHLMRVPLAYFQTRPAGVTVARMRELESIRSFLTGQGLTSALDLLFSLVFFWVLFLYSPKLTFIVLASLPCYVGIGLTVRPLLHTKIAERFNRGSATQQFLVETVVGIQTLKASAVEPMLRSQWEERLAAYLRSAFDASTLSNIGQIATQFINKATVALVLFFGAQSVISGDLTVGALVAFNMLMGQATLPILRLSQLWQDFQQVQVSVERLGDILSSPTETRPLALASLPTPRGDIQIRDVTFRYRNDAPEVLKDINLCIPAGQVLGIVGASGSGKSTLTKLIQRFYRPDRGQVLLDGVDIAQVDPAWVRRQIGVVQQEDILFNRTVHDNIALANPAMSRAHVIALARLAGADEFIERLPLGYDTPIEERGANLSGGQRQRIAIARALATQPRILILDEATSALDYESESIIRENMRRIAKDRTVIIVAHRLAAVRNCHRIIALSEGKIVEDGDHASLLADPNSIYRKLWHMQSKGNEGRTS
jgi:subfamily B ATP-binding cassette protein HlyB/CyaB